MFPIQQQDGDRNAANAAVDDLAVHSIRGLLIHIRLAGINAKQAILGQHIQPVGIHGLGGICPPHFHQKAIEHLFAAHGVGCAAGFGGNFRLMQAQQCDHVIAPGNAFHGCFIKFLGIKQNKEHAVGMALQHGDRFRGKVLVRIQHPGIAGTGLCLNNGPVLLAVVGSTADDGIKPKVDACGTDGILVDLCHKVVDQFIIQAVGALQDGLRMVKKAL